MSGEALPWELPDPYVQERVVEAGEMDRLDHANNTAYVRWCEEAGWRHTEAVGCGFEQWREIGRAMAMYRASLEYRAPCFAGERIAVGVWMVANDERLRATRRFQIVRPADGRTLFRADVTYASIDLASGRPRRMPEAFKKAYAVLPGVAEALAAEKRR
jgi:acyl-CoA thioester hydrolase